MKSYLIFQPKGKKIKRKIRFDSETYKDLGDKISIYIPKGELADVIEIEKSLIYEIEFEKEKTKKKQKVTNKITGF